MAKIRPFRGVRPQRELAEKVASLPYDVMNTEEAREMAAGNPWSFLHVSRPEIDLEPGIDSRGDEVHEKGRENLRKLISDGILTQDPEPCYYIYRQKMGPYVQTGLVVCAAVDDYESGAIKKHELTRADKEEDRVRHIDRLDANDEPVFYTFRHSAEIGALVASLASGEPEYDFVTGDGVSHTLWTVRDRSAVERLTALFAGVETLYVADGHHRSAAACRVRDLRRRGNPGHTGEEEYNSFLTVIFPDDEMNIMPYNRVVRDLNGASVESFLARVAERFEIEKTEERSPARRHDFGMYLAGTWYRLTARTGAFDASDPLSSLDVSIMQENLLSPLLGIGNPRTDKRIDFVGGIRGVDELERLVDSGAWAVAFSMHATSMEELMALADAGEIMPPKSTWFEPKLRSGLFVHLLS
jgi:uncharacterized protein (DUF1015 family)